MPQLARIEAQLMPFGGPVDSAAARPWIPPVHAAVHAAGLAEDLRRPKPGASERDAAGPLERPLLRAVREADLSLAYADHVDGEINDQYRSRGGALKFLKNIILLPGCGQFVPGASFVLRQPGSDDLGGGGLDERGFAGRGAHDADLRAARLSGTRAGAHADANFGGGAARDEIPGIDADGDLGELAPRCSSTKNSDFTTIRTFTAGVWPR